MSGVSYAHNFHGSFARNLTREMLRRLFGEVTQGIYIRISPDCPSQSLAVEWLYDAGWRPQPSFGEATEGDLHLLLLELGDHDLSDRAQALEIMGARRPWVVVIGTADSDVPALDRHLAAASYSFVWFDGTYRYYTASERAVRLERAFTERLPLEKLTPPYVFSDARIAMTLRCRDCDAVPKVPDAGRVIEESGVGPVQVMHNGIRVVADGYGGAWTTRLIYLCRGHHEPQEERIFHEVVSRLPANASMIEVGGYWAYYSLWFLHGGDHRRAIVIEPDPAYLDVGRRNAKLNGLSPEFVAGFVGSKEGPPQPFQTESSGLVNLPCFSIPQLIAEYGVDHLNLLHCDAQGAELAVLESCRELFQRGAICWVFISTHACQITGDPLTHQRCLALVQGLGGKVVAEHDVHESYSGDGLIVAWFGQCDPVLSVPNISRNRYSESMFRNPLYEIDAANDQVALAQNNAAKAEAIRAATEKERAAADAERASAEARAAEAAAARAAADAERVAAEVRATEAAAAHAAADAERAAAELRAAEAAAARAAADAERAAAEARAGRAYALLAAARAECSAALREVEAFRESTSWRLTAPLRFLSDSLRRTWR